MLIDTHAHLTDVKYGGAREIIDNMEQDGLERIIAVGFNEFTSAYSVKIAEENEKIFAAVGVHPSDAATAGLSRCAFRPLRLRQVRGDRRNRA